jgi:CDP-diacylglycerol--glycerol-3-phosphate 3-phosphatidyltransferase
MGVGDFLVHWFLWLLAPLEKAALALSWPPIAFNFIGLACGTVTGAFFAFGHFPEGAVAILAGGVCDILDGRIARRTNASSSRGAFVDSTFDRFVEVFAFLGLVRSLGNLLGGAFAAAAAMGGSLLVSYTRARGESLGVVCKEGLMQRAERLVLLFVAGLLDAAASRALLSPPGTLMLWTCGIIGTATLLTAAQRTWWITRRLKEH